MKRIQFNEMQAEFIRVLEKYGFTTEKAETLAFVFAESSLEGVYSHGANRFPRFIDQIKRKLVIVDAEPEKVNAMGALEQWDGKLGPGILNALAMADRAKLLATEFGIGCVGLAHTNHWMRAGSYGRRVAADGFIYIGWTNTMPNMPAWGAADCRLGNNPLVLAVPGKETPVVLDMAMSQFSYGKMEVVKQAGQQLSIPGGFNDAGELTTDPADILAAQRPLSVGYWKGAGLSMLLDIIATLISGGLSTRQIGDLGGDPIREYNVSQVFIAIDINKLHSVNHVMDVVDSIIQDVKKSEPSNSSTEITYPGERVLQIRNDNLEKGIPMNENIWNTIKSL